MKRLVLTVAFLTLGCASTPKIILPMPPAPVCEICSEMEVIECFHTVGVVILELQEDGSGTPQIVPLINQSMGCRCIVSYEGGQFVTAGLVDPAFCFAVPMKRTPDIATADEVPDDGSL